MTASTRIAIDISNGRHAAAALVSPRMSPAASFFFRGGELTENSMRDGSARDVSRDSSQDASEDASRDAAMIQCVVGHDAGAGPRTSRVSAEMRVAAVEANMA